ncbi:MAG: hypothetical protein AAFQ63_20980, partial [Cyanobacteria bacterium J06621_11]
SIFNVVLIFSLSSESTVREVRFLSTRFKGNSSSATQPKLLALDFLDDSGNTIEEREIELDTPTYLGWETNEFEPVTGVSRIRMRPLEPLQPSQTLLTFNEVQFYGFSNNTARTPESEEECRNVSEFD